MGKPDSLSRHSTEEKYRMNIYFWNAGLLLDLKNIYAGAEKDAEHIELEGIDLARWERKNRLLGVPQEQRVEVMWQHHDSQVAQH